MNIPGCECCDPEIIETKDSHGDWVKYEDHKDEIEKFQNLINGLNNQIKILKEGK